MKRVGDVDRAPTPVDYLVSCHHDQKYYEKRKHLASENTISVIDGNQALGHSLGVLTKSELLAELDRVARNRAEMARVLELPAARISEIFGGKRDLSYDEAYKLIVHYKIEIGTSSITSVAPSADTLEPLIDALLPLAPLPGRMTDQSRRALAEAFAYGLGLLDGHPSSPPSGDAILVAARAATARFRDLTN